MSLTQRLSAAKEYLSETASAVSTTVKAALAPVPQLDDRIMAALQPHKEIEKILFESLHQKYWGMVDEVPSDEIGSPSFNRIEKVSTSAIIDSFIPGGVDLGKSRRVSRLLRKFSGNPNTVFAVGDGQLTLAMTENSSACMSPDDRKVALVYLTHEGDLNFAEYDLRSSSHNQEVLEVKLPNRSEDGWNAGVPILTYSADSRELNAAVISNNKGSFSLDAFFDIGGENRRSETGYAVFGKPLSVAVKGNHVAIGGKHGVYMYRIDKNVERVADISVPGDLTAVCPSSGGNYVALAWSEDIGDPGWLQSRQHIELYRLDGKKYVRSDSHTDANEKKITGLNFNIDASMLAISDTDKIRLVSMGRNTVTDYQIEESVDDHLADDELTHGEGCYRKGSNPDAIADSLVKTLADRPDIARKVYDKLVEKYIPEQKRKYDLERIHGMPFE